jgi:DNA-binding SARP family transcriptional activator
MKRVEISLLGPARVCLDGEPIRFRTDSTCALLAYLALHAGLPCRREALAGLLWPEQPEPAAFHNLRQTLLNLRHALGDPEDDSFSTTRHTVQLNLSDNCWADVCAFQAAAAEALAASKAGSAQHAETYESAQRLAAAVALYQGDLLSGFSYPSASFEEWLVVERERLSLQTLEVLCQLAAYHERRAEYELTLRYARRQLEL